MMVEVWIAIVAGVSTAVPGTIAALAAYRKAARTEEHTRPNGQGSLVQMGERTLLLLGKLDGRLDQIAGKLDDHVGDLSAHRKAQES